MILQKLASAIRRQDWFQVVIEVLIVIVGIFLGFQVQAWYDDQQLKEREKGYLSNLQEDIETNLVMIRESLIERDFVEQGLTEILDSYADSKPTSELSNAHCRAVSISHKQSNPLSELPAARELISSGSLQIISNEHIRRGVSNYFGVLDIIRDRRTSTQLFMVDITGLYPDIIQIDPQNARRLNEGNNPDNRCDFERGRNNQQFINHLSMNSGRQWQLTRSIYEQITALEHLGQLIEEELDFNHQ